MSHYVKRILQVGESMKGIVRDKDRNHCGRLTTIDEFSKLLLAVDNLYLEAKKDKVCQTNLKGLFFRKKRNYRAWNYFL